MQMRELRLTRKKLNPDNKEILSDIRLYIYAKGVNEKILKEIELDIAGMLLESQERGEDAGETIGEDYKAFCDELIKNCPRKKPIDYVIYILLMFSSLILGYALLIYLHPFYNMNVEGFMLHCKVNELISELGIIVAVMVGSTVLAPIRQKNSFNKGKGCLVAFLCFVLYIVVDIKILYYIYDRVPVNQMISINLLKVVIVSGLIAAITWGVMEWRMRRQLVNYKKNSGENQ
jgi:DNA-binding ferritin-like protein (Dps family)